MFRGAFILAIGYIAGYSHAASRTDEIGKVVQDIKKVWADLGEADIPNNEADDNVKGAVLRRRSRDTTRVNEVEEGE